MTPWRGAGTAVRVRTDGGSASVLAVVFAAVLAVAALLTSALGGVVADQRRVESAADLTALAAAGAIQAGEDPCAAAASVARRNDGRLSGCEASGEEVVVEVTRDRVVLGHRVRLSGHARGGPARDPESGARITRLAVPPGAWSAADRRQRLGGGGIW